MSIDEGQKIEQTTNNFDEAVDSDGYLADVETPGPKVPKRKGKLPLIESDTTTDFDQQAN